MAAVANPAAAQALAALVPDLSPETLASLYDSLLKIARADERASVEAAVAPPSSPNAEVAAANPFRETAAPSALSRKLGVLICANLSIEDGHFARLACRCLRDAVDGARRAGRPPREPAAGSLACSSVARVEWMLEHVRVTPSWARRIHLWGALSGSGDVVRWARVRGQELTEATIEAAVRGDGGEALGVCLDELTPAPGGLEKLLLRTSRLGRARCVAELIRAGAAVNSAAAASGGTALLCACFHGHVGAVRALLDGGADVDKADRDGTTPLSIASQQGHAGVVHQLLGHGAVVDKCRQDGSAPLLLASLNGHVDVVQVLLNARAAVERPSNYGYTPLLSACFGGRIEAARLLLKHGANAHRAQAGGWTTLMAACHSGSQQCVALMIAHGVHIEAEALGENGETALIAACLKGHLEVVQLLIAAGADVMHAVQGRLPLTWATAYGQSQVAALLRKAGAEEEVYAAA